jgi:hypothetical protein
MNQNWNDQQEKKIEDFWVFELHSTFEFVKDSILILDFGIRILDFAGI